MTSPRSIKNVKSGTHLNLCQRDGRVMRKAADALAGVAVVERVAAVGGRQAQVAAGLHRWNVLVWEYESRHIGMLSDIEDLSSVTRWLWYLFNVCPLRTLKIGMPKNIDFLPKEVQIFADTK